MFKKVSIIGGGGTVGSTTAFCLAGKGICNEIFIYDAVTNLSHHHAYDINCSICKTSPTSIIAAGDKTDIAGSDVVVIASSFPTGDGGVFKCSGELLTSIANIAAILRDYAPDAAVLTLSNPVDVINTLLWKLSGKPAKQFFGFSLNDSIRLDMAVAKFIGCSPSKIESYCVGEHGFSKVPVLSDVKVDGVKRVFTDADAETIQNSAAKDWADFLGLGITRTAGWSTGTYASLCIEAMIKDHEEALECSVILDGEYGYKDLSLGTPVYLCRDGVKKVVELELNEREKGLLHKSYELVQARIDGLIKLAKEAGLL